MCSAARGHARVSGLFCAILQQRSAMSGQPDNGPAGPTSDIHANPAAAQGAASLPLSNANTADNAELEQVAQAAAAAARKAKAPAALQEQSDRPSGQGRPSAQRGLVQWMSMKSRLADDATAKGMGAGSEVEDRGTAGGKFADRATAQNYFQIKQSALLPRAQAQGGACFRNAMLVFEMHACFRNAWGRMWCGFNRDAAG